MREVKIGNTSFTVRSLRRKEIRENGLGDYGYKTFLYSPPMIPDGKTVDLDKAAKGQEIVLDLVIDGGVDAVDMAGGEAGIRKVWTALIAETYSIEGEEKNSPTSGRPDQTKDEKTPAPAA